MNPRCKKYLLFRLRMSLLYPPGLLVVAYFRWIAPLFGTTHVAWARLRIPQLFGQAVLRFNGVEVEVEGFETLRKYGDTACVLLTNHNSRFDGYILLAQLPFNFKSFWSNIDHLTFERFKLISVFGRVFDLFFRHEKIDPRVTLAEFKKAEQYLRDGGSVSLFPEGRFSPDGAVHEIGLSCLALALRAQVPIIPIVLIGTRATYEDPQHNGGAPVIVRMVVHAPISTAGLVRNKLPELAGHIEQLMNRTLNDTIDSIDPLQTGRMLTSPNPEPSGCGVEHCALGGGDRSVLGHTKSAARRGDL